MTGPPNAPARVNIVANIADPVTWIVKFLRDRWPAGSDRPFIVRRLDAPGADVAEGSWILSYSVNDEPHPKRGQGNVEDAEFTFTLDIRSRDRETCWSIKETVLHGFLEPYRVFPHPDWTEWEWKIRPVTSYGDFNQIVIDVTLRKWKRRRTPNVLLS